MNSNPLKPKFQMPARSMVARARTSATLARAETTAIASLPALTAPTEPAAPAASGTLPESAAPTASVAPKDNAAPAAGATAAASTAPSARAKSAANAKRPTPGRAPKSAGVTIELPADDPVLSRPVRHPGFDPYEGLPDTLVMDFFEAARRCVATTPWDRIGSDQPMPIEVPDLAFDGCSLVVRASGGPRAIALFSSYEAYRASVDQTCSTFGQIATGASYSVLNFFSLGEISRAATAAAVTRGVRVNDRESYPLPAFVTPRGRLRPMTETDLRIWIVVLSRIHDVCRLSGLRPPEARAGTSSKASEKRRPGRHVRTVQSSMLH